MAIALIIILLSVILAIYKPIWGLNLAFLYIPVKWLMKNIIPLTNSFYMAYLPLLTVAILVGVFLQRKGQGRPFIEGWDLLKSKGIKGLWQLMKPFDKGLLLMVIWQMVVNLISYLTYGKISNLIIGTLVWWQAFGLYIVARLVLDNQDDFKKFIKFNLVIATIVAVVGIGQYYSGWQSPKEWVEQYDWTVKTRIISTVGNPNGLAGYLIAWILLALNLISEYWAEVKLRYALAGSIILMTLAVLLTYSRGGWIALTGAVIYLAITRNKKFLAYFIVVAALAGLISIQTGQNSVGKRITNITNKEHISSSMKAGRVKTAELSLNVIKKHPITGTGLGMFGGTVAVSKGSPVFAEAGKIGDMDRYFLDDEIIHVTTEQGIVGLLLIIFMWWQLTFKNVKENKGNYFLTATGALWLAFTIQGAVANVMEFPQIALMVWTFAAIAQNNKESLT